MDLKAYYLEYKNIPWYYGICATNIKDARLDVYEMWKQMCMKDSIKITVPAMNAYDWIDEDNYDE